MANAQQHFRLNAPNADPKLCVRKRSFPTESEAVRCNPGLRAYRCEVCNGWHLTSGIIGKATKSRMILEPATIDWIEHRLRNRRARTSGRVYVRLDY